MIVVILSTHLMDLRPSEAKLWFRVRAHILSVRYAQQYHFKILTAPTSFSTYLNWPINDEKLDTAWNVHNQDKVRKQQNYEILDPKGFP